MHILVVTGGQPLVVVVVPVVTSGDGESTVVVVVVVVVTRGDGENNVVAVVVVIHGNGENTVVVVVVVAVGPCGDGGKHSCCCGCRCCDSW